MLSLSIGVQAFLVACLQITFYFYNQTLELHLWLRNLFKNLPPEYLITYNWTSWAKKSDSRPRKTSIWWLSRTRALPIRKNLLPQRRHWFLWDKIAPGRKMDSNMPLADFSYFVSDKHVRCSYQPRTISCQILRAFRTCLVDLDEKTSILQSVVSCSHLTIQDEFSIIMKDSCQFMSFTCAAVEKFDFQDGLGWNDVGKRLFQQKDTVIQADIIAINTIYWPNHGACIFSVTPHAIQFY